MSFIRVERREAMEREEQTAIMLQRIEEEYAATELQVQEKNLVEDVVMISMPDGIRLKTYIFHPEDSFGKTDACFPVILQRSPYYENMTIYRTHAKNLVKRGFVYVLQCCRGTGGSEGEWQPNVNERADGLATLEYLSHLTWVKNIGYWGESYVALAGWCMADAVPEKVKGMYLSVYGTERFVSAYEKHSFRHDILTSWAMSCAGFPITADYMESCRYRPHIEVDERLWGERLPWYREWITNVDENDAYWQEGFWKQLADIPRNVHIPLFIQEGWYDHHLGSAVVSYEKLNADAKEHSVLQIGCWNHLCQNVLEWDSPKNLENFVVEPMVSWFKSLLIDEKVPKKRLEAYVIGEDRWVALENWPLVPREIKKLYIADQNMLFQPMNKESRREFDYDPDNPVPSHGAEAMLLGMSKVGSLYQPMPGYRMDVISFISEPIKEDFIIGGKIKVKLTVSSDCYDTAFTAKLMEQKPDGRYVNIRSSITTIAADCPEKSYRPGEKIQVTIEMWDIIWKVEAGAVLRLDISSSDFPQYSVHTNYMGIWSHQDKCRIAHQTIYCGGENSYVELPVINMKNRREMEN